MKKLLLTLLLIVPLVGFSQSQNENYVISRTYKDTLRTQQVGHDKNKVMTNIQYFDGLGRLKQSIGLEAGGKTISSNIMPLDWTSGNIGSTNFYNRIGSDPENRIISGTTPFGETDLLWECIPDAISNADGGWNTDYFEIDNTKSYRYSIWVKKNKTGITAQGRTYHGIQNVDNLDGNANGNPYFTHLLLPNANTWYLLVGVIHPHSYRGANTGISGVYDINGNKLAGGNEFRWRSDNTQTRLRSYLFYTTDTSVRQYFWSPLFQEIDGSEASIDDIVNRSSTLVGEEKIKDIVTHVSYDNLGRQTKEYLPFSNGVNNANIRTGDVGLATQKYYGQKYAEDFAGVSLPGDINAYSEKSFDNSPLNRVMKQGAPGKDWKLGNNHEIRLDYQTNLKTEVRKFYVTTSFANNTYTPTLQLNTASTNNIGFYEEGELFKSITKDENWTSGLDHTTEEFKNKQGQVILKRTYNNNERHDTYYIYDDFGNLTYVLPPKMNGTTSSLSTVRSMLNNLGYQYKYDHLNRLVEKKIPGKGWEYIVYDKLDRPVMTRDTNLKAKNRWLYTKYDHLGRVAFTGEHYDPTARINMQILAETSPAYVQNVVRKTSSSVVGGTSVFYTNNTIPIGIREIYTINYYDTYVDLPSGLSNTVTTSYGEKSTTNTKGLPTVSKVKVLETSNWITTVTYYDDKARPIYVYSKNDYLNTIDIVESKLDYLTGKVLETKTTHKKTGKDDIITVDRFEYDHMDRLVSQTQQINDQVSERIVKNNYDDLGQLESKLVGNGTKTGYKHNVATTVSVNDNVISKIGGNQSTWDADICTEGSITGDGYVEFEAGSKNKYYMVGLSNNNNTASFASIKYAIYLNHSVYIFESGKNKGLKSTYKIGDIFKVERIGNKIYYKKNDEIIYTSLITSSGDLYGDVSMYHIGGIIKDFKTVDNSKGLQKVDYKYNVRGWLTNINEDVDNDNDLFNFTINYNNTTSAAPLYNGNISQTSWQTENVDKSKRTYNYTYDALNRILSAIDNTGRYNLNFVNYDKNGNITALRRQGHRNAQATSFGTMDDLVYGYKPNSNELIKVDDTIDNYGFKEIASTSIEYTYDANGNMITDKNKGITSITYNHLNLPTSVGFSSKQAAISYTYAADGTKLSKVVAGSGLATTTTQYAGNHIYENGELQFFSHAEGYVSAELVSGTLKFENVYQYKDHLGNMRLSYTDNNGDGNITQNEIVEEKNYYPFGLQHKGYNSGKSSIGNSKAEMFSFGGKELNQELGIEWHDFGARNYEASLGRWMNIDPLGEKMRRHSPYNYAFDNPIYFVDPDGMMPRGPIERPLKSQVISTSGVSVNYSHRHYYQNTNSKGYIVSGSHSHNYVNNTHRSNFKGSETRINTYNTNTVPAVTAFIASAKTGLPHLHEGVDIVEEVKTDVVGTYYNSEGDIVDSIDDGASTLIVDTTVTTTRTKFSGMEEPIKGGTTKKVVKTTSSYNIVKGITEIKETNKSTSSTMRTVNYDTTSPSFQDFVNLYTDFNQGRREVYLKKFEAATEKFLYDLDKATKDQWRNIKYH
ncbi:DUF6443 domain-containing protein [Tenacibaculum sp. 190524A05c]|uniref:Rhs family protein n=1 Tax=Tenacibaculum platacis TaxID=3137852 RepID=A0ABP1EIW9_9FLAO